MTPVNSLAEASSADALPEKAQLIIEAAFKVIYDKGLDQVTLSDVAKRAGVTTGAVTYYFEDKEALLIAAYDQTCSSLREEIVAYGNGLCAERFAVALPTNLERCQKWTVWLAFSLRARNSQKLARIFREDSARTEAIIADITGLKDPDAALELATKIMAITDGIGISAILSPDSWPPEQQEKILKSLLTPVIEAAPTH